MAQPNVVREPSMEEILASIRRIIESNEPGAGKSISASLPPVYAEESDDEGDEEIHLTVDNDNRSRDPDMASLTRSYPDVQPTPSAYAQQDNLRSFEDRKSMSLADVAARVRAASERNTEQLRQQRDAPPPRFETPAAPRPIAASRPVELRKPPEMTPSFETHQPETVAAPVSETKPTVAVEEEPLAALTRVVQPFPPTQARPAPVHSAAPDPVAQSFEFEDEYQAEETVDDVIVPKDEVRSANEAKALLSSSAGEKVARSFSELATVLDGPRRSVDEIAEEMLRPMLQEWLDDNLPTLVERLVREEIERVARGPRR